MERHIYLRRHGATYRRLSKTESGCWKGEGENERENERVKHRPTERETERKKKADRHSSTYTRPEKTRSLG